MDWVHLPRLECIQLDMFYTRFVLNWVDISLHHKLNMIFDLQLQRILLDTACNVVVYLLYSIYLLRTSYIQFYPFDLDVLQSHNLYKQDHRRWIRLYQNHTQYILLHLLLVEPNLVDIFYIRSVQLYLGDRFQYNHRNWNDLKYYVSQLDKLYIRNYLKLNLDLLTCASSHSDIIYTKENHDSRQY